MFATSCYLSLSWARWIQYTPSSYFERCILTISSHLRLCLPNGPIPSGFPTKCILEGFHTLWKRYKYLFWAAVGWRRLEVRRLCLPFHTAGVQYVQTEICGTLDGGALHTTLSACTVSFTAVVKFFTRNVVLAFILTARYTHTHDILLE